VGPALAAGKSLLLIQASDPILERPGPCGRGFCLAPIRVEPINNHHSIITRKGAQIDLRGGNNFHPNDLVK
jgi:hypothetical protein